MEPEVEKTLLVGIIHLLFTLPQVSIRKDLDQYLREERCDCYHWFSNGLVFRNVFRAREKGREVSHTSTITQLSCNAKGPTSYTLLCGAKPTFMQKPTSFNYGPAVTNQLPESGLCQLTILLPKNLDCFVLV